MERSGEIMIFKLAPRASIFHPFNIFYNCDNEQLSDLHCKLELKQKHISLSQHSPPWSHIPILAAKPSPPRSPNKCLSKLLRASISIPNFEDPFSVQISESPKYDNLYNHFKFLYAAHTALCANCRIHFHTHDGVCPQ